MKVCVLVGCYAGVIDEVKLFTDEEQANRAKEELRKDYGIREGHEEDSEHAFGLYEFEV